MNLDGTLIALANIGQIEKSNVIVNHTLQTALMEGLTPASETIFIIREIAEVITGLV